ncbi:Transcription elongation factor SPT5 [Ceratocystis lukuohia]|uniref:Transcription elongation factor SPT5 n=2 Tax=Ceratocystis TaxID=5157 RepID=A0A0F8BTK6_CERFI|nr:Transcription elongation factor SPT5 [Ceratocystis platani]
MSDRYESSEEEDFNPAPEVRSDDEDDNEKHVEPSSEARDRSSPAPQKTRNVATEEEEDDLEEVEDEEEEEEEEDDEEDEEDDVQSGHRRKRRKDHRNAYFDIEAEVDEDEEEDDELDEEEVGNFIEQDNPEDLAEAARLNDDRRHRELDRRRDMAASMDAEKQAEILRQRYGNRRSGRGPGDVAAVPKRLLLPSVDDPKIWAVKAREGKEREVVFSLIKRMDELVGTKNELKVTSAFERAGPDSVMKGYIYVEAMRQADVHTALEGLMNVYPRTKMHLVEIKDMPDLLRVTKNPTLEPGAWVRLRKPFKHAGDLAQVIDVTENGLEARVRFIPRLDYGVREETTSADGKRKRPAGPGPRPPQRLFSEQEARKRQPRNVVGNPSTNTWTYNGDEFENGFQVKDIKIQQLIIDDVNPKLEEVTKFASGAEDGTESLDLKALAASLKNSNATVVYLPGDVVEVHSGEQKGVIGRTTGVHGDIVTLNVIEGTLVGQTIDVPTKNLRKRFKMGDHVKVVGGSRFQDEVGMVVKIEDDRVTLVTDTTNNEITVFSRDLREASDSGGQTTLGQYSLHDIVQLDATTVGCIIKIDRESMTVLDQNGDTRQSIPSQIPNKIPPRRHAVAADRNSAEIQTGDVVREYGNLQRRGTIMHIHRSTLFLQTHETTENGGIFVVRSSNVTTVAAKGGRVAANGGPDLSAMNPAMKRNGPKGMGPPPKPMGRDRSIGQTVVIRRGIYKGLLGIVKDATDVTARVELHARNKIVSVSKEHLSYRDKITGEPVDPFGKGGPRPLNGAGAGAGSGDRGSGSGRVPSWQTGGRTPAYNSSERTPAWGSRTPAPGGGRTPAWKQDNSGSRTPAWADGSRTVNPYDGSRTAYGSGSRTPAWAASGGKTPAHDSYGNGGRTPAYGSDSWNSGSKTPAYGTSVATPAAPSDGWGYTPGASGSSSHAFDAPTPGAGLLGAPTPGAMNAPTPGAYSAPTPGALSAPTPGGWNSWGADSAPTPAAGAPTPAASGYASGGYYGAPTPGAYGGVPDTPAPRYDEDD